MTRALLQHPSFSDKHFVSVELDRKSNEISVKVLVFIVWLRSYGEVVLCSRLDRIPVSLLESSKTMKLLLCQSKADFRLR